MVVKIGSSTVVGSDGKVNRAFIGGAGRQGAAPRQAPPLSAGLPIRPQPCANSVGAWSW